MLFFLVAYKLFYRVKKLEKRNIQAQQTSNNNNGIAQIHTNLKEKGKRKYYLFKNRDMQFF